MKNDAVAFALMIWGMGLGLKDFKNSLRVLIVTVFVVIISPSLFCFYGIKAMQF